MDKKAALGKNIDISLIHCKRHKMQICSSQYINSLFLGISIKYGSYIKINL